MEDYMHILSAWHKLEHFSPASLPSKDKAAKLSNELPWTNPQKPSKPNKKWQYTIYLGVIQQKEVNKFIKKIFHDEREIYNEPNGRSCYAIIKLDEKGSYIQNTLGISTMPWALAQLENGEIKSDSWAEPFKSINTEISDRLVADQYDLLGSLSGQQTLSKLNKIEAIIKEKINWKSSPQTDIYVMEEEINKNNDSQDADKSGNEIINSYFVEDLERIIKSRKDGMHYKKAFVDYLNACMNKPFNHIDISENVNVIKDSLVPEKYPDGCWPSTYNASLMQQFAINSVCNSLQEGNHEGLFSVNGPPGTGKTTLLKDIIAAILVKRAKAMVEFDNDNFESALKHVGEINVDGGYNAWFYKPDDSLCFGGIVVASTNNGAVENISKELPQKEKIKDGDKIAYFRKEAEECLDKGYWGLIAAVLGKKKNLDALINSIWNKDIKDFPLKVRLSKTEEEHPDWKGITASFNNKLAQVQGEKKRLTEIMDETKEISDIKAKIIVLNKEKESCKNELDRENIEAEGLTKKSKEEQCKLALAKRRVGQLQSMCPCKLSLLISRKRWKKYNNYYNLALTDFNELNKSIKHLKRCIDEIANRRIKLIDMLSSNEAILNELINKYNNLISKHDSYREELGGAYADDDFWNNIETKSSQQESPWYSKKLKELQSDLFVEAMKVNEAFVILANCGKSKRIKTSLDALFALLNKGGEVKQEDVKAMWDIFWLVVPVVSTTFASIGRMFSMAGPNTIPWLFIDEAGQAVPQAAAGAIWRSQRAVIVGDPFQIEPVVTISENIVSKISECFHLDTDNINNVLSVQSMADRANKYGWTMNETWTGCPLRVHRRCLNPMFDIANKIAYEGKMFNSTFNNGECSLLMKNEFIQVYGKVNGRHYVPEQGKIICDMVIDEILNQKDSLPDLFVISPFSEIPFRIKNQLREGVRNNPVVKEKIKKQNFEGWMKEHIGTVHTFQGKEAEGVILCLGLDKTGNGAASWASSKPNLLNVAVTRAKKRFTAVGDGEMWLKMRYFCELDTKLEKREVNPTLDDVFKDNPDDGCEEYEAV